MPKKVHTCIDCRCHAVNHIVSRHSRHVVREQITFFCGAQQDEIFDSESMTGRVKFEGCNCAG